MIKYRLYKKDMIAHYRHAAQNFILGYSSIFVSMSSRRTKRKMLK